MMVGLEGLVIVNVIISIVFFIVVFLLILSIPLILYYLVRAEHDQREEMTREDAERAARRDTHKKP